jgi:uncharacterized protein
MNRVSKERLDLDKPLDPSWLGNLYGAHSGPIAADFLAADLPRLASAVAGITGPVHWSLAIDRDHSRAGKAINRYWLEVAASVAVTCERCLSPMPIELKARRGFEFVASAEMADSLTEAWLEDQAADPDLAEVDYLAPEDGISLRDLVEDELLLSLPAMPKHPSCKPPAGLAQPDQAGTQTQTKDNPDSQTTQPFAGLKDLMKPKT